jgi:hypothetical protein
MRIGTKSLLIGAHAFWLHPFMVALGWFRLNRFRTIRYLEIETNILDWRLWLCFFVHDLGYWGCPNMDGEEGERHPIRGADLVYRITGSSDWRTFCLFHSSSYSKPYPPSPLSLPDKLATVMVPTFLYVLMTRLTGEIREYKSVPKHGWVGSGLEGTTWKDDINWFNSMKRQRLEKTFGISRSPDHEPGRKAPPSKGG